MHLSAPVSFISPHTLSPPFVPTLPTDPDPHCQLILSPTRFSLRPQTPSIAVVEMMQCLTQAMAVTVRKPASNKPSDLATAVLMQLPHFDGEVCELGRSLGRNDACVGVVWGDVLFGLVWIPH